MKKICNSREHLLGKWFILFTTPRIFNTAIEIPLGADVDTEKDSSYSSICGVTEYEFMTKNSIYSYTRDVKPIRKGTNFFLDY